MPGLRDLCYHDNLSCCVCEENNCSISLSPRGDTVLFVDGEEAIIGKPHCDCIIVLKRGRSNMTILEIYSVELKSIQVTRPEDARDALDPNSLRQKCENCIEWAFALVKQFQTSSQNPSTRIAKYCIIAVPSETFMNIATLIGRERWRLRPRNSDGGRIVACNESVTGRALLAF